MGKQGLFWLKMECFAHSAFADKCSVVAARTRCGLEQLPQTTYSPRSHLASLICSYLCIWSASDGGMDRDERWKDPHGSVFSSLQYPKSFATQPWQQQNLLSTFDSTKNHRSRHLLWWTNDSMCFFVSCGASLDVNNGTNSLLYHVHPLLWLANRLDHLRVQSLYLEFNKARRSQLCETQTQIIHGGRISITCLLKLRLLIPPLQWLDADCAQRKCAERLYLYPPGTRGWYQWVWDAWHNTLSSEGEMGRLAWVGWQWEPRRVIDRQKNH